ncbi:MAG: HEAT repeat domain-containing protein [Deltaproteobacteria bacterium]|nr:HEAT repeat domain-containing protein [Deltaproteobacteria bacterium]
MRALARIALVLGLIGCAREIDQRSVAQGPTAQLDSLIRALDAPEPAERRRAFRELAALPAEQLGRSRARILERLRSGQAGDQGLAWSEDLVALLVALRPEGIGLLREALARGDADERALAADGLVRSGEAGLHVLVAALTALGGVDPAIRNRAAEAASALASEPQRAKRLQAAHLLGRIAADGFAHSPADGRAVLARLDRSLEDEDASVRVAALGALRLLGAHALPALDRAVALLADPEPRVSRAASEALARFGPPGVEALKGLLGSPEAALRRSTLVAVRQLDAVDDAWAELLLPLADDPDAGVRLEAYRTLARQVVDLRSRAGTAQRALVALKRAAAADPSAQVRAEVIALLGSVPGAAENVGVLRRALGQQEPVVLEQTIASLAELGHRARAAAPELERLSLSGPSALRPRALAALVAVQPDGKRLARRLGRLLEKSQDPDVQVLAARELGKLGLAAADDQMPLIKAMTRKDERLRDTAMNAILAIRKAQRQASG